MQINDLDMGYVLRLEPKAAVDYLKSKGYQITWDWHEMLEDAHVKSYTVAKATKMEVLETLRVAVEDAVQNGVSERDFIKNLTPTLQQLGWWGKTVTTDGSTVQLGSPHRLKTIYRTNKTVAYHAGRYARQMENIDEQPYWQYVAINDARTRASHLALHGKVYRADDPIWETLYPPNDWGCRCRVRALSEFKVQREGLKIDSSSGQLKAVEAVAGVKSETGEEVRVEVTQVTTDKGTMKTGASWNYNVGRAAYGTDVNVIRKLQQVQNRELRQQTIQAINHNRERHKRFADWVGKMLSKNKHDNHYMSVGIISTDIAEKVAQLSKNAKQTEQVLVMTERNFTHANSPKHRNKGVALSAQEFASLPQIISDPACVVWDNKHKNLIYVNQDKSIKVVAELSPTDKKVRLEPKEKLDAIINTYKLDYPDFVGKVKKGDYVLIKGKL